MASGDICGRSLGQVALPQAVAGQHHPTLFGRLTAPCAPCAGMLEKLCLAQAQECVFEKARTDKKSPAILARLVQSPLHSSAREHWRQPPQIESASAGSSTGAYLDAPFS